MNRTKWFVGAVTGLALSSTAIADTWTAAVTPTSAQAFDYSGTLQISIATSQSVSNPAGCPTVDAYIANDTLITNSTLAIALAALASGSQIQLFISSSQCVAGRPMILGIKEL